MAAESSNITFLESLGLEMIRPVRVWGTKLENIDEILSQPGALDHRYDIPGYPGFTITLDGEHIFNPNGKEVSMSWSCGLKVAHVRNAEGEDTKQSVARLMGYTFLGPPDHGIDMIKHIDQARKFDNHIKNLRWAIPSDPKVIPGSQKDEVRRPVIQLALDGTFIHRWDSIQAASESIGITIDEINTVCQDSKGSRSVGGFKWRYEALVVEVEEWLNINAPTLETHQVSNAGRIRFPDGTVTFGYCGVDGIMSVDLRIMVDGQEIVKTCQVHFLVAITFLIDTYRKGYVVNHVGDGKTDNRAISLAWGSEVQTADYAALHGAISGASIFRPVARIHPTLNQITRIFRCANEATSFHNLCNGNVNIACQQKFKVGGYSWRYLDDKELGFQQMLVEYHLGGCQVIEDTSIKGRQTRKSVIRIHPWTNQIMDVYTNFEDARVRFDVSTLSHHKKLYDGEVVVAKDYKWQLVEHLDVEFQRQLRIFTDNRSIALMDRAVETIGINPVFRLDPVTYDVNGYYRNCGDAASSPENPGRDSISRAIKSGGAEVKSKKKTGGRFFWADFNCQLPNVKQKIQQGLLGTFGGIVAIPDPIHRTTSSASSSIGVTVETISIQIGDRDDMTKWNGTRVKKRFQELGLTGGHGAKKEELIAAINRHLASQNQIESAISQSPE